MTDRRLEALRAALGFLRLGSNAPELQLLHAWLDSWAGIGLVVTGMTRLGFELGLDQRTGAWLAVFYAGSGGHRPVAPAAVAQAVSPWAAVQTAALEALRRG
jgi:hypothetical protein